MINVYIVNLACTSDNSVIYLELVVIGGFQCAKSGHTRDFRKTRPDAHRGQKSEPSPGPERMVTLPNKYRKWHFWVGLGV